MNGHMLSRSENVTGLMMMGDDTEQLVLYFVYDSRKDEASGEVPVAFVVQSPGFHLSEEEVKTFISKQVKFYCLIIPHSNSAGPCN
jgi:hypothetical protein